jgi:hypothetical protein
MAPCGSFFVSSGVRSNGPELVTEESLKQALRRAAEIVAHFGDHYMPIVNRIGSELETRRIQRDNLLRIMAEREPLTLELRVNESKSLDGLRSAERDLP